MNGNVFNKNAFDENIFKGNVFNENINISDISSKKFPFYKRISFLKIFQNQWLDTIMI